MEYAELNCVVAEAVKKAMAAHDRRTANRQPPMRWRRRATRTPWTNRPGMMR